MQGTVIGGIEPAKAVKFDGTNDYMTRSDFVGVAQGKMGILSFWVRFNGAGNPSGQSILVTLVGGSSVGLSITKANTGQIWVAAKNTLTNDLSLLTNSTWTGTTGWLHVLSSWSLPTAGHLYVNDTSDLDTSPAPVLNNANLRYNGNVVFSTSGAAKLLADVAEFYFNTVAYLDLTVEANRRKFVSAAGKPAFLGRTGEKPTGSSPILYMRGPVANFPTNLGTGGPFTVTGALDDVADLPHL